MPDLTPIESYAIKWIADGDEPIVGIHPDDWQEATSLRNAIGNTIADNPDAFMAWYLSIRPFPKGD